MILKKSDISSINKTADILKNGGIVIIPTDTVYGFSGIVDLSDSTSHFETDAKSIFYLSPNQKTIDLS